MRENADNTSEELLCKAIFRILTFQWTSSRHSHGPANFIPFDTFYCSVRCIVLSYAVRGEEAQGTGINWGSVHMQPSARMPQSCKATSGPHWAPRCPGVFLLSHHPLYARAKNIVQLTNPFPTQQVQCSRFSIVKKRIWILKPFKSMPKAGANKNKSELWETFITVTSLG